MIVPAGVIPETRARAPPRRQSPERRASRPALYDLGAALA